MCIGRALTNARGSAVQTEESNRISFVRLLRRTLTLAHPPMRRLLNARTFAYYTSAYIFIVPLIFIAALLEQGGAVLKSLTAILMFVLFFIFLEVLRRFFPGAHAQFLRISAPGTAMLGNWIALMFFALMVKLPTAIARATGGALVIVGWLGTIVVGQVLNLLFTVAIAKLCEQFMHRCGCIKDEEEADADTISMRLLKSSKLPLPSRRVSKSVRAKSRRADSQARESVAGQMARTPSTPQVLPQPSGQELAAARPSARYASGPSAWATARQRFVEHMRDGATDDAPDVHGGSLMAVQHFVLKQRDMGHGEAELEAMRKAALEAALVHIDPANSFLATELRRVIDAQRPRATTGVGAAETTKMRSLSVYRDQESGEAAAKSEEVEPELEEPPPLLLPTWPEVFELHSRVAIFSAIAIIFIAPRAVAGSSAANDALEAFVWLFQLTAGLAGHVFVTFMLKTRVPPKYHVLVQPALLSPLLLIIVAGASSLNGFLAGCEEFVIRDAAAAGHFAATPFGSLTPMAFGAWGPGRVITIGLIPAITVLAFPTSARMPEVQPLLPVLLPLVGIDTLFAMVSIAILSRLMIPTSDVFALSTIPHTVTVAVAIGFSDVLCAPNATGLAAAEAAAAMAAGSPIPQPAFCATETVIATTGVLCATLTMIFGRQALDLMGVRQEGNEFTRGFALGTTGQAMSVASLKLAGEERATGVAAISFALTAVWASLIMSIHVFVAQFLDPLTT